MIKNLVGPTLALVAVFAVAPSAFAEGVKALSTDQLCPGWSLPVKLGELDAKIVSESSGLTVSKKTDFIYHMNDSGTGPEFYVSKMDGTGLSTVHVDGFKPIDPEDLAIGPCATKPSASCLVIADIGDNKKRRSFVDLVFVEETVPFAKIVKAHFTAYFRYPDGPHNAEALAVLDNGDVIIVTKEMSILGLATPAIVFRAKRADYVKVSSALKPTLLERIGELNLPAINMQKGFGGIATGLAATARGDRFTVLTYTGAIEFSLDLKSAKLPALLSAASYRMVPLLPLAQQESISYHKNERDLIYSTELPKHFVGIGDAAPMYIVRCDH